MDGENQSYNIKLDVFEGPFDLLLTLLEKNKIDIADINICAIADQYIEILQENFNMEIASEFLVMASWLLRLKSKRLLPQEEKEEEEISEEELIRRLNEYKKYKDITPQITEMYSMWSKAYYKMPEKINFPKRYLPITIDPDNLANCYSDLAKRYEDKHNDNREKMDDILKTEKVSLRAKMRQVVSHIVKRVKTTFSSIFTKKESKAEVVTGFLAVLELNKRKKILTHQEENFGEITITPGSDIETEDDFLNMDDTSDFESDEEDSIWSQLQK
ncbi:MAG: chromosome segregation protein ScpA [Ruminococcaceae bacterium]|nr:chromosome segregation protein ScpA [Oscillospiraceae bacterium]